MTVAPEAMAAARPSKDILEQFYGLAVMDQAIRQKAVCKLIEQLNDDVTAIDYCVERLVTGLCSSRAAARLGFSTALILILERCHDRWTVAKLLQLAEKKMLLKQQEHSLEVASAVGHHLLCAVMVDSSVYHNELSAILEKEVSLMKQYSFLTASVLHTVTQIALSLDVDDFKKKIWPLIETNLTSAVNGGAADYILMALRLRTKFAKQVSHCVSFVQKDGSCKFEPSQYAGLLKAMKSADPSVLKRFLDHLLSASREAKQFKDIYLNVIEKWVITGDESRVLQRMFNTAELSLQGGSDPSEVVAVLSGMLMKRVIAVMKGRQGPQERMLKKKVKSFFAFIDSRLTGVTDGASIQKTLEALDALGNIDDITQTHITGHLIERMNEKTAKKWVETISSEWSLRRAAAASRHWTTATKASVARSLLSNQKKDLATQTVIYTMLDHMFYIKVRAGDLVSVQFSDENETVLKSMVEQVVEKDVVKKAEKNLAKAGDVLSRSLRILWLCLKLWSGITTDEAEKTALEGHSDEVLQIAQSTGEDTNITVLVDLLTALLAQPRRHYRSVVHFVFVRLLSSIKAEHVIHIVDSLKMEDAELLGEGTASDGEDEDEDMEVDDEADDEDEDVVEEESSSEEEDNADMDEEFVSRLEEALGNAAVKRKLGKSDEEDSDVSDLDDDAMVAMDERLSAAFRAIAPKQKKEASDVANALRSKLSDLLLFAVSSTETAPEVKLALIVPLLQLAKIQTRKGPTGAGTKRAIDLLAAIAKLKKITISEKRVLKTLAKVVEEASILATPLLVPTVATIVAFLFSLCVVDGACSDKARDAFFELFEKFVRAEETKLEADVVTAAIYKLPVHFVSRLDDVVNMAFAEENRVFHRTTALQCAAALCTVGTVDKRLAKSVGKTISKYLTEAEEKPAEVKPRFFCATLKLLNVIVSNNDDAAVQKALTKTVLPIVKSLESNVEVWKGDLKKCNKPGMQYCGKQPVHILKGIVKKLEVEETDDAEEQ